MRILLMRHAHAVADGPGLGDSDRYLSGRGREAAHGVGRRLRDAGLAIERVWTSPLVRAVQTAELAAMSAGFAGSVVALPALGTMGSPHAVAQRLAATAEDVLLVGHAPSISSLGAILVSDPGFVSLNPADCVLIDRGHAVWKLDSQTLELRELVLR